MLEIEELIIDIDKLRDSLYRLIEQKGFELNDPEVLEASKRLNIAITYYNELLKDRMIVK